MPRYGQAIIGPPGSGKTTYCNGMQQYLRAIGRKCLVVNFDPANEVPVSLPNAVTSTNHDENKSESAAEHESHLPYDTLIDVCEDIVSISSVMEELDLGPNGGLVYCMEYIEKHFDHVMEQIESRLNALEEEEVENDSSVSYYILFDFPGQVELYTHCTCVQNMLKRLVDEADFRLTAVQLIDAHQCADPSKFISAVLLATTMMLRLELPTVNVLSKVDLINQYGSLAFNLDFFTDVMDPTRLLEYLDNPNPSHNDGAEDSTSYVDDEEYQQARANTRNSKFYRKHRKLHEQMCDLIDDFSLVSFIPLDIQSAESVGRVVAQADKCNGYIFGMHELQNPDSSGNMFRCAVQADPEWSTFERMADVHERFMADSSFQEEIPELQRKHGDVSQVET